MCVCMRVYAYVRLYEYVTVFMWVCVYYIFNADQSRSIGQVLVSILFPVFPVM